MRETEKKKKGKNDLCLKRATNKQANENIINSNSKINTNIMKITANRQDAMTMNRQDADTIMTMNRQDAMTMNRQDADTEMTMNRQDAMTMNRQDAYTVIHKLC